MKLTLTEQILLLGLWRLGENTTGFALHQHFNEMTGRDVAFGTIYNNMDQLIRKGFAVTFKGEANAVRGGRAKRYYRLTEMGLEALEYSQNLQQRLWEGVPVDAFSRPPKS